MKKPGQNTQSRASIAELKARLSAYLGEVRAGGEVLITHRGHPVARLVPMGLAEEGDERVKQLVAKGLLREAQDPLPDDFASRPRPQDPSGRGVEVVLEERAEGR